MYDNIHVLTYLNEPAHLCCYATKTGNQCEKIPIATDQIYFNCKSQAFHTNYS